MKRVVSLVCLILCVSFCSCDQGHPFNHTYVVWIDVTNVNEGESRIKELSLSIGDRVSVTNEALGRGFYSFWVSSSLSNVEPCDPKVIMGLVEAEKAQASYRVTVKASIGYKTLPWGSGCRCPVLEKSILLSPGQGVLFQFDDLKCKVKYVGIVNLDEAGLK